jgi:hypothetical protein
MVANVRQPRGRGFSGISLPGKLTQMRGEANEDNRSADTGKCNSNERRIPIRIVLAEAPPRSRKRYGSRRSNQIDERHGDGTHKTYNAHFASCFCRTCSRRLQGIKGRAHG